MKDNPNTLERIVKGFFDGACATGDAAGVVLGRLTGVETAGRYGMYNEDTHRREMGRTKTYRAAKAMGAVGGVAVHVTTGGLSILYGSLILNGIKGGYHVGSQIYHKKVGR